MVIGPEVRRVLFGRVLFTRSSAVVFERCVGVLTLSGPGVRLGLHITSSFTRLPDVTSGRELERLLRPVKKGGREGTHDFLFPYCSGSP